MSRHVKDGTWMVLVPGAVAYLRYRGEANPNSAAAIYELLNELGFLDDVDRDPDSVLGRRKRWHGLRIWSAWRAAWPGVRAGTSTGNC